MKLWILAFSSLALRASAAPLAQEDEPACTREALIEAADAYIAAQTEGSLDALAAFLAEEWIYWEDNEEIDPSTSVLATKALKLDHRRTNADVVECASYTEIISADPAKPYVIGTQIRHGADLKITKIDSVASTTNSWVFDAKKTLDYVVKEDWFEIPEADWDDRDVIKAAGTRTWTCGVMRRRRTRCRGVRRARGWKGRRTRDGARRRIRARWGCRRTITRRRTRIGDTWWIR
ncbi:unnamed protein product [Parascedosporium putredinis]|uniref:SnoaL-like domain-containing protein n=1 Tax=Parascedosporium putredinis TaxID=1442378 RepID=A0A9P1MD12_9PEZI|nr:unnamed protein product [Parascedosporium putredinis]CAI8001764.1 unnamed protein product [Parascedosporium putredinis]